jgi:hypothetical protein
LAVSTNGDISLPDLPPDLSFAGATGEVSQVNLPSEIARSVESSEVLVARGDSVTDDQLSVKDRTIFEMQTDLSNIQQEFNIEVIVRSFVMMDLNNKLTKLTSVLSLSCMEENT